MSRISPNYVRCERCETEYIKSDGHECARDKWQDTKAEIHKLRAERSRIMDIICTIAAHCGNDERDIRHMGYRGTRY